MHTVSTWGGIVPDLAAKIGPVSAVVRRVLDKDGRPTLHLEMTGIPAAGHDLHDRVAEAEKATAAETLQRLRQQYAESDAAADLEQAKAAAEKSRATADRLAAELGKARADAAAALLDGRESGVLFAKVAALEVASPEANRQAAAAASKLDQADANAVAFAGRLWATAITEGEADARERQVAAAAEVDRLAGLVAEQFVEAFGANPGDDGITVERIMSPDLAAAPAKSAYYRPMAMRDLRTDAVSYSLPSRIT